MDEIILSYLAGVLDSDGCISVRRSTYAMRVTGDSSQPVYSERITVKQVTPEAVSLFAETFGGNVRMTDPSAKRGRPLYTWEVTDRKAAQALSSLLPYLRIKRAQAANCLDLRLVKERSKISRVAYGRGHVGSAARPKEIGEEMEYHFLRAKNLNRVGV